jgi:hypothetical protein
MVPTHHRSARWRLLATMVLCSFAVASIAATTDTAMAEEEIAVSHTCLYSTLCQQFRYYDWWEVEAANGYDEYGPISFDDPCDRNTYGLPKECDWNGPPFQNHNWKIAAVQLMAPDAVQSLAIGVFKDRRHLVTAVGIGCRGIENCFEQYSSVQTSAPGGANEDHVAIAQGYADSCIFAPATEDEGPCARRRLWGFEGE